MVLDRRPLLALAAGGLLVAGTAVLLVTRPLWHEVFTPHILASVVLTANLVIVPVVLGRISRSGRMVWGVGVAASGAGMMALYLTLMNLAGGSAEVLSVEDALQFGFAGGLAAGGGVVLAGTSVLLLREAGVRHLGWVEERGGEGYVPVCACGWEGEARPDPDEALVEAGDHAGKVRLPP